MGKLLKKISKEQARRDPSTDEHDVHDPGQAATSSSQPNTGSPKKPKDTRTPYGNLKQVPSKKQKKSVEDTRTPYGDVRHLRLLGKDRMSSPKLRQPPVQASSRRL